MSERLPPQDMNFDDIDDVAFAKLCVQMAFQCDGRLEADGQTLRPRTPAEQKHLEATAKALGVGVPARRSR